MAKHIIEPVEKDVTRKLQKLQRLQIITSMALAGADQKDIAVAAKCSRRTVIRYLDNLKREWINDTKRNVDEIVGELFAYLKHIYAESMKGWTRSQRDKETHLVEDVDAGTATTTEGGSSAVGKPRKKRSIRREAQAGEAAFLDKALNAVGRMCTLVGANAPSKLAVDGNIKSVVEADTTMQGAVVAAAREVIVNDPAYIEYLRQRAFQSDPQSRPVGVALQQGPMEDVQAPCVGGLAPD